MDNAKKMILIEPEVIEKLKNDNRNTNLSRFDEEMRKVLFTKIDDREKWAQYSQILQRYLYFVGKDRKPLEIPILSLDATQTNKRQDNEEYGTDSTQDFAKTVDQRDSDIYTKSHLIKLLPKTYKKNGELLIDLLQKHRDNIYWDNRGTVFINNKEIYNSNIVDLLNDAIRPLKNSSPSGWMEFTKVLKDIRVPLSYLGNSRRIAFLNILNNTPNFGKKFETNPEKEIEYSTPRTSCSTVGADKEKIKRKIDWQKWTPY